MTERWEDLGGQPSTVPLPRVEPRPNKPHPGPCDHRDGHTCPVAAETTIDSHGYETTTLCDCTKEDSA